jgi:very-short-patch-repair endonuclease
MIVHRVTQLPKADITVVRSIPATEPSRTLLDLAAVVSQETLEMALEDAWRRGLVSLARLRWRLAGTRSKGRKGASALRRLLLERPAGTVPTDSALEVRFLQVARKGGLVPSERQYEIRNNGKLISRVDFAYVASKLAIEVDGFKWHSGRASWERDLSRGNTVGALGWRVLHATSRMLDSPDELLQTIRDYLGK